MRFFFLTAVAVLAMPMLGIAQTAAPSSVCASGASVADDAVLTICTHAHGMAPLAQPRLYLRLYADGRAEFETEPPFRESAGDANFILVKKAFRVTPDEIQDILRWGRASDFQHADAAYPIFRSWEDSSLETRVVYRDNGIAKQIVLGNFSTSDQEDRQRYPPSLFALMEKAERLREQAMGIVRPIPSISFCELIKNRADYFGKKVTIYADLEATDQGEYLNDPACVAPTMGARRTTEKIGVGYSAEEEKGAEGWEVKASELRLGRFGGHARVMVTGILNVEEATPAPYRYRFDITEFGSIEPITIPYEGSLEPGWNYTDTFDYLKANGLALSSPLKLRRHQTARIEWINLDRFPALKTSGRKHITFRVVSAHSEQIGSNRIMTKIVCEILDLS